MQIIIHSSKSMSSNSRLDKFNYQKPMFLNKAKELNDFLNNLEDQEIKKSMHISDKILKSTRSITHNWDVGVSKQKPAIDSFIGDVYSGLQANNWNKAEREFANNHLKIVSGLYGILKAEDSIMPYRLEFGYRFNNQEFDNLYKFWGNITNKIFNINEIIIDLTSQEYGKLFLPYINNKYIYKPTFLTFDPRTKTYKNTAVHSKIARGAFANWLVKLIVDEIPDFKSFNLLGYEYSKIDSTKNNPIYHCREFKGLGLSIRLLN